MGSSHVMSVPAGLSPDQGWEDFERRLDLRSTPWVAELVSDDIEPPGEGYGGSHPIAEQLHVFRERQSRYSRSVVRRNDEILALISSVAPSNRPYSARGRRHAFMAKRFFDVVVATVALVLLAPLVVTIALLVKLSSPGPVFFRTSRMGARSAPFHVMRFRTFDVAAFQDPGGRRGEPVVEPTSIGRLLWRTGLVDLPQLVNVIKGNMSLVGPHPLPLPSEAMWWPLSEGDADRLGLESVALDRWLEARREMRPGLTGPGVLDGGGDFDRLVASEVEYFERWSPRRDFKILVRTVAYVFAPPSGRTSAL